MVYKNSGLKDFKSPLNVTLALGNYFCVEVIMEFMSKSGLAKMNRFATIFKDLIEVKNFMLTLKNLHTKTQIYEEKHILRVTSKSTDRFVKIHEHSTTYLDSEFFQTKFLENENAKSYPIKLMAMRIDWVFDK